MKAMEFRVPFETICCRGNGANMDLKNNNHGKTFAQMNERTQMNEKEDIDQICLKREGLTF